jgi:hypothetical protein
MVRKKWGNMHNDMKQGMQVMNSNGGKATRVHTECCTIASMLMVLAQKRSLQYNQFIIL